MSMIPLGASSCARKAISQSTEQWRIFVKTWFYLCVHFCHGKYMKVCNFTCSVMLHTHCRRDLEWWQQVINSWNGALLLVREAQIQIESDALGTGWGGVFKKLLEVSGVWSTDVKFRSSNFRELLAILLTIRSLGQVLQGKSVQVLSDNVTAVAYINHMGGQDFLCILLPQLYLQNAGPRCTLISEISPRRKQWICRPIIPPSIGGSRGACPAHAPLWDPILSFSHTFSLKSAHIRGPHPP